MKNQASANIFAGSRSALRPVVISALVCGAFVTACVSDEPGISNPPDGNAGEATSPEAGSPPDGTSGSSSGKAGSTATGGSASSLGGQGGSDPSEPPIGTAGTTGAGGTTDETDAGGQSGAGGAAEPPVAMSCIFHTAAPPPVDANGGAGSAPPADIVVQQNAFLGAYLTDAGGRTLYTYGADLPGDCQGAPVSRCEADCLVSWPIFSGGQRVLGAGLDDAAFGSIVRGDGSTQATYYGWPLYYYKADLSLGQLTGQGKAKVWHAAELTPPSIVIMKAGTAKYLADGAGRTLYVSSADQAGGSSDPVSNCSDACLDTFVPFHDHHISVVSSLEPSDFSVFVRKGKGGLQLAYKGLPLYLSQADKVPGDTHGTETPGFTAAVP